MNDEHPWDRLLAASATPELPVDPDDARLDELARRHPEGLGRWYLGGR